MKKQKDEGIKICARCQRAIIEGECYYKVEVFNFRGKIDNKISYIHHSCWQDMFYNRNQFNEVISLAKNMYGGMVQSGMLPPQEVVIE